MWEEAAGPGRRLCLREKDHTGSAAAVPPRSWNLQVRLLIKESNNKTPVSPDTALGRQAPPHSWDKRRSEQGGQAAEGRPGGLQPGRGASWPIWGEGQCCSWGCPPRAAGRPS